MKQLKERRRFGVGRVDEDCNPADLTGGAAPNGAAHSAHGNRKAVAPSGFLLRRGFPRTRGWLAGAGFCPASAGARHWRRRGRARWPLTRFFRGCWRRRGPAATRMPKGSPHAQVRQHPAAPRRVAQPPRKTPVPAPAWEWQCSWLPRGMIALPSASLRLRDCGEKVSLVGISGKQAPRGGA